jgi:hypothetical protein
MTLGGKQFLVDMFRGFDHEQAAVASRKAYEVAGQKKYLITKDNIRIEEELVIESDHINAAIAAHFDVDKRFGTATFDTDDYINFYADYYPDTDKLDAYYTIYYADGTESDSIRVELEPSEQKAIFYEMELAGLDIALDEMIREQRGGMKFE